MLGSLWAAGIRIDWQRVMPEGGNVVQLPLYPWQRERHWADVGGNASGGRMPHHLPAFGLTKIPGLALSPGMDSRPKHPATPAVTGRDTVACRGRR